MINNFLQFLTNSIISIIFFEVYNSSLLTDKNTLITENIHLFETILFLEKSFFRKRGVYTKLKIDNIMMSIRNPISYSRKKNIIRHDFIVWITYKSHLNLKKKKKLNHFYP